MTGMSFGNIRRNRNSRSLQLTRQSVLFTWRERPSYPIDLLGEIHGYLPDAQVREVVHCRSPGGASSGIVLLESIPRHQIALHSPCIRSLPPFPISYLLFPRSYERRQHVPSEPLHLPELIQRTEAADEVVDADAGKRIDPLDNVIGRADRTPLQEIHRLA